MSSVAGERADSSGEDLQAKLEDIKTTLLAEMAGLRAEMRRTGGRVKRLAVLVGGLAVLGALAVDVPADAAKLPYEISGYREVDGFQPTVTVRAGWTSTRTPLTVQEPGAGESCGVVIAWAWKSDYPVDLAGTHESDAIPGDVLVSAATEGLYVGQDCERPAFRSADPIDPSHVRFDVVTIFLPVSSPSKDIWYDLRPRVAWVGAGCFRTLATRTPRSLN